jgi:hypothetical protein
MPALVARSDALLNTFRLNQRRLGEAAPRFTVIIGSDWRHEDIRVDSVTMTDAINDEPNTLSFRLEGAAPVEGAAITVWVGPTLQNDSIFFAGQILSVQAVYESLPRNLAYDVQAIDHTWLLKRRLVSAWYPAQSATATVLAIVRDFAPGYVANHVVAGLPVIDEISFSNEDVPNAISRVMEAIGGYWYVDYGRSIHAFLTDTEQASPITDYQPNTMINIAQTTDLSQVSNRILARGGGSKATADCTPTGSFHTTVPVEDLGWYQVSAPPGGAWLEIGSQRVIYGSTQGESGTGSTILGDTVGVQTAPTVAAVATTPGKLSGRYQYKTTFVSKEGESMASPPSASVLVGVAPPDVTGVVCSLHGDPGGMPPGVSARYVITFITAQGETLPSAPTNASAPTTAQSSYFDVYPLPIGPPGTTKRKLYRSDNGKAFGATMTIPDNTTTALGGVGIGWDAAIPGAAPPVLPTAGGGQVSVSAIAIGTVSGAVITARNLYRTKGDGTNYFYRLVTIRDNTTTTYVDNTHDDNLGSEEPTRGTLGTLPGSTALRVSALEAFVGYGWVYAANQLLFYAARSPENGPTTSGPGALVGIPASGTGSITSPLSVDTEVMNAPHLVSVQQPGVGGLKYPLLKGDTISVLAIVEDAVSQQRMAAAVGFGDGVHELHIGDNNWTFTECQARARAELQRRKDPLVSITFETRDDSVWSGRDVPINIPEPRIVGTFKIRRVTFSQFGLTVWPLRRVEVTSQRFSFEDLLRQTRGEK